MSYNRPPPQPTPNPGGTQYNVRDAALLGASSAFSKPPVKPKPIGQTYTGGGNGALTAATRAGASHQSSPVQKQWTGGSYQSQPSPLPWSVKSNGSSILELPPDPHSNRASSPSNIAAKLAAARSTPLKSKPEPAHSYFTPLKASDTEHEDILPPAGMIGDAKARLSLSAGKPQPQSRHDSHESSVPIPQDSRRNSEKTKATDDASILPTNSLVQMFEQARAKTPTTSSSTTSVLTSRGAPPPVKSPKPQRKIPFAIPDEAASSAEHHSIQNTSNTAAKPKPKLPELTTTKAGVGRPKPPTPRRPRPKSQEINTYHSPRSLTGSLDEETRSSRPRSVSINGNDENDSSPTSFTSAPETQAELKSKPSLPPPRRIGTRKPDSRSESSSKPLAPKVLPRSNTAAQVGRLTAPPETFPPPRATAALTSQSSGSSMYHSNYQRASLRQMTPHITGDSLANAMVGAALASSRNASPAPSRSPLPPLPIRNQPPKKHHHHPFHSSRSPSPTKSKPGPGKLRTTMRKESTSSESEDSDERYKRKGKRVLGMGRKHPNKHHEGDRKRWRDVITECERKRYEGVWAANKGLFIVPDTSKSPSPNRVDADLDPAWDVHALVVRDVWARSRLPEHVLEEVWNLVDSRGIGRLRREEFVVGLWHASANTQYRGHQGPARFFDSAEQEAFAEARVSRWLRDMPSVPSTEPQPPLSAPQFNPAAPSIPTLSPSLRQHPTVHTGFITRNELDARRPDLPQRLHGLAGFSLWAKHDKTFKARKMEKRTARPGQEPNGLSEPRPVETHH
ncbi:uncharacterized protein BDZ99DRAFT_565532 [Mytilinidion resinicola]|uniref:EH domain-containing protein n=1 Tax=Mytilinidion resinicola TaxID=574789 RepID=A0A6A6ZBC4_9PEZI|nr:uncharacterized protein BDZ99DRAFT_565532 [Mytilinidion resinicola]KAF2817999.1 hypothetical protein BDZ99DRAFT_565532 [Mytilinidion resinicola]